MFGGAEYDVLIEGVRALFFIGIPVVVVVSVAGIIVSSLQAATTIYDVASAYGVRLLALLAILYFMFPAFSRTCINLAETAFR